MDFQITTDINNPNGTLVLDKNENILTDIFLSVNTPLGSFFQNPTFGCNLWSIKKITTSNILLAKQYVQQALAWLIKVGRALTIDVIVEQDSTNRGQLNIKVTATQPDGLMITYTYFQRVV